MLGRARRSQSLLTWDRGPSFSTRIAAAAVLLNERRMTDDQSSSAPVAIEDPVVASARDYAEIVLGLHAGLDPLFASAGDALIETAVDTVGRLGSAIGAKVSRLFQAQLRA